MPTILVMELTARAVSAGSAVDLTHAPKAGTTPPHHRPCQFTDRLIFDPFFNAGATPERLSVETASTQHHDTLSLADIRREIAAVHSSLISTAEANAGATPLSELLKTHIVDLADADLRTHPRPKVLSWADDVEEKDTLDAEMTAAKEKLPTCGGDAASVSTHNTAKRCYGTLISDEEGLYALLCKRFQSDDDRDSRLHAQDL